MGSNTKGPTCLAQFCRTGDLCWAVPAFCVACASASCGQSFCDFGHSSCTRFLLLGICDEQAGTCLPSFLMCSCSAAVVSCCLCSLATSLTLNMVQRVIPQKFWNFLLEVDSHTAGERDAEQHEQFLRAAAGAFLANSTTDQLDLVGFDVSDAKRG